MQNSLHGRLTPSLTWRKKKNSWCSGMAFCTICTIVAWHSEDGLWEYSAISAPHYLTICREIISNVSPRNYKGHPNWEVDMCEQASDAYARGPACHHQSQWVVPRRNRTTGKYLTFFVLFTNKVLVSTLVLTIFPNTRFCCSWPSFCVM